jgi:hypothetical protein
MFRILNFKFSCLRNLEPACHQFSKSEIEVADFDRLLSKLERIKMNHPATKEMLVAIKESG